MAAAIDMLMETLLQGMLDDQSRNVVLILQ